MSIQPPTKTPPIMRYVKKALDNEAGELPAFPLIPAGAAVHVLEWDKADALIEYYGLRVVVELAQLTKDPPPGGVPPPPPANALEASAGNGLPNREQ